MLPEEVARYDEHWLDVAEQVIIFIKDTDGDLAEKYMSDKIGSRHHFEKIDEFETHLV